MTYDKRTDLVEMPIDGSQVLVGVFGDQQGADRALNALATAGFEREQINILAKSRGEAQALADQISPGATDESFAEPEAHRMQGEVDVEQVSKINLGTGLGVLTGAAAGIAVGLAAIGFPGLSSISSPVAAAVCGVVGAAIGAWGGSLAGVSVPDEDTSYFTGDMEKGAFLVAVRTIRIDEAIDLLRDAGARNFEEGVAAH